MAKPLPGPLPQRSPFALLAFAGTVLVSCSGCASTPASGSRTTDGIGNAIVVGDESFGSGSGSILSVLQNHVRGMSVAQTDDCPHIVLRAGARSQVAEALVYVDGQRMSDTCILDGLNLESVDHIEVYPSGVTQRPGYHSNSGGLILVFTKNGPQATKDR